MSRRWSVKENYDYTREAISCKHCGNKTIMKIVSKGVYIREVKDEPIDEQTRHELRTLFCPTCEKVNVLEYQEYSEVDPDDIHPKISYLYPSSRTISNTNPELQSIRSAYEEVEGAFTAKLYPLSVIGCRRVVELLCKLHKVEEGNLQSCIRKLYERAIIDEMLHDWANAVRLFGNDAAHTQSNFSQSDARDIKEFTFSFMEYLLDLRWKFAALTERQAKPSKRREPDQQVSVLLKALDDSNNFIRYYAAKNLLQLDIEIEKVFPVLIDLFEREEGGLLSSLEECIVQTGALAIPELMRLITSEKTEDNPKKGKSNERRKASIRALGKIGAKEDSAVFALTRLIKEIEHVSENERIEAVSALGKTGTRNVSVLDELISILNNPIMEEKIKSAAAISLQKLGSAARGAFVGYYEQPRV